MPSLTPAQAGVLARPALFPGLREDQPTIDQLLPIVPWTPIAGHQQNVASVTAAGLGAAAWIGAGGITADSSAVPTVPAATFPLKRICRDVILDSLLEDTRSEEVDIAQVQVDAALRSIQYRLGDGLINGSIAAVPSQIQGLKNLVTPAKTVGAAGDAPNGGALLLGDLDRLVGRVTAKNGRADFLVMNLATLRAWKKLLYDHGSAPPVVWRCPEPLAPCPACAAGAADCPEGLPSYAHGGCPILVSEFVRSDEAKGAGVGLTSAYALCLGPGQGLCLTYPARAGRSLFKVERIVNPFGDQERYRVILNVGLTLWSAAALARLDGILN